MRNKILGEINLVLCDTLSPYLACCSFVGEMLITLISSVTYDSIDNDVDTEHGPASKKRKTASVIVDQPAESDKMVVDQVTDVSATFEEVWTIPVVF